MGSGSPGYRIQLHSGRVSQAAHHLASPSRKGECQHAHGKINIKNYFNKLANTHWQNTRQCRISHQTWPVINNKKNLGTTQIQPHRALTGHWIVCTHVGRLKAPNSRGSVPTSARYPTNKITGTVVEPNPKSPFRHLDFSTSATAERRTSKNLLLPFYIGVLHSTWRVSV